MFFRMARTVSRLPARRAFSRAARSFDSVKPSAARLAAAAEAEYRRGLELLEASRVPAAAEAFASAAADGSAGGNYFLALGYDGLLGDNAEGEPWLEINKDAAFRCYSRAAGQGHAEASFNLALCYRWGDGCDASVRKAFEVMEQAAALQSERAAFNLGVALDPLHPPWVAPGEAGPVEGRAVAKDAPRAVAFYRQAAAAGHGKAQVNLGVALYTGTGVEKPDVEAAVRLWSEAAEAGEPEAAEAAERALRNMDEPGVSSFKREFE